MKPMRLVMLSAAVAIAPLLMNSVRAQDVSVGVEVSSVNDFEQPLASYGSWVEVGPYGRCWRPAYVDPGWRPYASGYWVWTDDGWYWQSDEPWGWACYHYGRWVEDPYYGWVWAPDTTWGPSWVCFRRGGGYVGWAPLSPGCQFGPSGEIVIEEGAIPESWFVCVNVHHFAEHHDRRTLIINNTTIINRTIVNFHIRRDHGRVITEGPKWDTIRKYNHEPVHTSTVTDLRSHERVPPVLRKNAGNPQKQPLPRVYNEPQPVERHQQPPPEIIRPQSPPPVERHQTPPPVERHEAKPPVEHHEVIQPPAQHHEQNQPPAAVERHAPPPEKAPLERRAPEGPKGGGEDRGHDRQQGGHEKDQEGNH